MNLKSSVIFIILIQASAASFGLDTKTYLETRQGARDSIVYYLLESHVAGLADGFHWANIHLKATNQKPIFCAPQGIRLNPENYMQAVDELLSLEPKRFVGPDVPLGGTVLLAMRAKLPCK